MSVLLIYLPSVVFVYAIIADAEQIFFKFHGLFGHEAAHYARIGRPVAALFSNVPLYFLEKLSDYRYARVFSLLSLIVCGCAMIRIMISRLWIRPAIAVISVIGICCLPGFFHALMNPTAWPMHILSIGITVGAYALLARSHACCLFLSKSARDLDGRGMVLGLFPRGRRGSVSLALVLLVVGLLTYPPSSLMLLIFPVAILLFSALPAPCRESLLLRDLAFISLGIVLYLLFSKAVYFPIGKMLTSAMEVDPNSPYRFVFDFNLSHDLGRLLDSLSIAKDLWFLPNFSNLVIGGWSVLLAVLALTHIFSAEAPRARIATLLVTAFGIVACYVISIAPVIFSEGGTISYRTIVVPSAIVMLVFMWTVAAIYRPVVAAVARRRAWLQSEWPWILTLFVAIFWATSYGICSVIQICQNELLYVATAVQKANAGHADGLLIVDGRPMFGPDLLPLARDVHGHALPPYESGCFSTYCIAAPGIYAVAKEETGIAESPFNIMILRDSRLRGLTCRQVLDDPRLSAPLKGWTAIFHYEITLHEFREKYPRLDCQEYGTKWLDLEWHPDASILKSSARIDRSIWRIFLP